MIMEEQHVMRPLAPMLAVSRVSVVEIHSAEESAILTRNTALTRGGHDRRSYSVSQR